MAEPARGMLRRPVGLLASTAARAAANPTAMGHTAVQEHSPLATESASTVAGPEEGDGTVGVAMPLVQACPITNASQHVALLERANAWPIGMAIAAGSVQTRLPWAQVRRLPPVCTSFGVSTGSESLCSSQARVVAVEAARSKALARMQVTHYKCMCCRALVPNEETVCGKCKYARAENGALARQEREKARAAARSQTRKGRQRNKCSSAVVPAHGLKSAPVGPYEREWREQIQTKRQKVTEETEALAMARCGDVYVEVEDSHACVFESFLQVCVRHMRVLHVETAWRLMRCGHSNAFTGALFWQVERARLVADRRG
jgi:hypothetical protein